MGLSIKKYAFLFLLFFFTPEFVISDDSTKPNSLAIEFGSFLIIGIPNTELSDKLRSFISKYQPGGFVFFQRNIKSAQQSKLLIESIKNLYPVERRNQILFAVDQEGGWVVRIREDKKIPSPERVGFLKNTNISYLFGKIIGEQLFDYGFNLNFAPVLDVSSDQKNTLSKKGRTFSADGLLVGKLGESFSRGLVESGVVPTAKHFPGGLDFVSDPHSSVVQSTNYTQERDLFPFSFFTQAFPFAAIMTSHLVYKNLDNALIPGTFSAAINIKLRNELGFKGVVISDDLLMTGASTFLSLKSSIIKAINSGVDFVLISNYEPNIEVAFGEIQKSVLVEDIDSDFFSARQANKFLFYSYLSSIRNSKGLRLTQAQKNEFYKNFK